MPPPRSLSISSYSPSLWGKLGRTFSPSEIDLIGAAFELAVQNGALHESGVERRPEASFNPRPARVAEIVLSACKDVDSLKVAASLLLCAEEISPESVPHELREAFKVCEAARLSLQGNRPPPDRAAAELLLAHFLDDLRHFHMRTDFLRQLEKELPVFEMRWSSYAAVAPASKLSELTSHAIERLKRFRQDPGNE